MSKNRAFLWTAVSFFVNDKKFTTRRIYYEYFKSQGFRTRTLGSLPFSTSAGGRRSVSRFDKDFDRQADTLAALYLDFYHESRENLRTKK